MAMPFWIHCNICNVLQDKENKLYLLSCTHILCKNCLKSTKGKKCPTCKCDVRLEDISKLPENLKNEFQPQAKDLLGRSLKVLRFQQNHIQNFAKKTCDYRKKLKQELQLYAKEKEEVMKLKAQYDALVKKRRLMQEKLKEIYVRNQNKRKNEIYRNPANSTVSSGISSAKTRFDSEESRSSVPTSSGFFIESSQMSSNFGSKTGSSDFFEGRLSKRRGSIDHTQSNRTPFFTD